MGSYYDAVIHRHIAKSTRTMSEKLERLKKKSTIIKKKKKWSKYNNCHIRNIISIRAKDEYNAFQKEKCKTIQYAVLTKQYHSHQLN